MFLIVFHVTFIGVAYLGFVSTMAEKKTEMINIIQNCAVNHIACCVVYSQCGNRTVSSDKYTDRRTASWIVLSVWTRNDDNTLISRLLLLL
ncbi:Calcineurin-like metallo-phosphoesterase superfamily protein, partial [Zea mays]